ncbi:MAG: peptidoglycan-binding protein [Actinomycetota bacterium]|nr:peptidoglycan-binding protein [Actinomycetota bacterium]
MQSPSRVLVALLGLFLFVLPSGAALAAKRNWSLGDRALLKRGDRGHDVKVLQDFLSRAGYRTSVDGDFGSGTVRAVRAFELAQGLRVDGRVARLDMRALRDVITNGGAVTASSVTGGTLPTEAQTRRVGPGAKAVVGPDGLAVAPAIAPPAVQAIIASGNRIAKLPYRYGGGHGSWIDTGYDCSGSVSYALHGGGLLNTPMASGDLMSWGVDGPGTWVTVYANGGHVYMVVAGLRFDTSGRSGTGSRWQTDTRSGVGYTVRHPLGL